VCGEREFERFHACHFDFTPYATQDPELHAYTGANVWLAWCRGCGFGQPEHMPVLPRFFDRMYDQRWSDEWIQSEFASGYKDLIFSTVLRELDRRIGNRPVRRLLDVGAHAGRFMKLAQHNGWHVEGIELNPKTAAYAASQTGAVVYRTDAAQLVERHRAFDAITLTDVLEHIPDPVRALSTLRPLLRRGGWVAVKVPCGPAQWWKERILATLKPGRRVSLADNLVHVNHFSPSSLDRALRAAGFSEVTVRVAAPELHPGSRRPATLLSNALRRTTYLLAKMPGGLRTPMTLHLQAYATNRLND
jgi:SAM-dependent methyltransferase